MNNFISDYAAYNLWANKRISNFISKVTDEMMNKTVKSSFPSLRKTITHIRNSEQTWLSRLTGVEPHRISDDNLQLTKDELCSEWCKVSVSLVKYAEEQNLSSLENVIHYRNTKGDACRNTVTEVLLHCMNHSTYHRGQIVTILREVGFTELASTDLITYFREKQKG